jgi:hypothetical protein
MSAADAQDYGALRARLVVEVDAMYAMTRAETGLASMSPAVRAALGKVERHRFVPSGQQSLAYRNHPLSIGSGQTISQPYIVALSTPGCSVQPALDRRSPRLEPGALVGLRHGIRAQRLDHVQGMRHRLDAGSVDRLQLVDEAQHPVQAVAHLGRLLIADRDAGKLRNAADLVVG